MKASELVAILQALMAQRGDPEVRASSHGCCSHAHDIESVEMGQPRFNFVDTSDEIGVIVIRV